MDNYKALEWNKLIAEFMELNTHKTKSVINTPINAYEWNHRLYASAELKFHTSWDWLMPVVEKIETIKHDSIAVLKEQEKVLSLPIYSKINTTWFAVVKFIIWYNESKSK